MKTKLYKKHIKIQKLKTKLYKKHIKIKKIRKFLIKYRVPMTTIEEIEATLYAKNLELIKLCKKLDEKNTFIITPRKKKYMCNKKVPCYSTIDNDSSSDYAPSE